MIIIIRWRCSSSRWRGLDSYSPGNFYSTERTLPPHAANITQNTVWISPVVHTANDVDIVKSISRSLNIKVNRQAIICAFSVSATNGILAYILAFYVWRRIVALWTNSIFDYGSMAWHARTSGEFVLDRFSFVFSPGCLGPLRVGARTVWFCRHYLEAIYAALSRVDGAGISKSAFRLHPHGAGKNWKKKPYANRLSRRNRSVFHYGSPLCFSFRRTVVATKFRIPGWAIFYHRFWSRWTPDFGHRAFLSILIMIFNLIVYFYVSRSRIRSEEYETLWIDNSNPP